MEIYLIRHTTPAVEKGICYGQSDLDVTVTFHNESNIIQQHIPSTIATVHSSPLQRCSKLAQQLFPAHSIQYHPHLKELNCGHWEMQLWDHINKEELDPWMNDFVNVAVPGGESYVQLYDRVVQTFNKINEQQMPAAIVTHGGVIRSILSHITHTPLIDSFNVFKLHYGCVVKIYADAHNSLQYQILSNIETEAEKHKPSAY
jgi:alpha-ribazole phosphatase